MGNCTMFRCSKILGEAGKQQLFENFRSQIVFRFGTDVFRKLTLGAPVWCLYCFQSLGHITVQCLLTQTSVKRTLTVTNRLWLSVFPLFVSEKDTNSAEVRASFLDISSRLPHRNALTEIGLDKRWGGGGGGGVLRGK